MPRRSLISKPEEAVELGDYDQSMIAHVEAGRRNLRSDAWIKSARLFHVSLDYLAGLVDDPTPAAQRLGAEAQSHINGIAETPAGYDPSAHATSERRPVEVLEVASAAGVGAEVYDETPIGLLWFRNDWLLSHSIDPEQSNIIRVRGASLEPTLPDGCSILVDRKRTEPQEDRIYVMRTEEGLVVKRLGLDEQDRWELLSDNPDWEPALLTYGTDIAGEVRWVARTL